jgi:hypothetical protein
MTEKGPMGFSANDRSSTHVSEVVGPVPSPGYPLNPTTRIFFIFIYIKKKILKIYAVFWKFSEMGVCRPPLGDMPPCHPLHGQPGPVAHPVGDRDLFVIKIFTTRLLGDLFVIKIFTSRHGGQVATPSPVPPGRQGPPRLYKPRSPLKSSFGAQKSRKKREG